MNYHNISLSFTNRDYKTGQPCYNIVWAYFTSRDDMQLNLKRDEGYINIKTVWLDIHVLISSLFFFFFVFN